MIFLIVLTNFYFVSAESSQIKIDYFYATGCSHCANVEASGILEELSLMQNVVLKKYNVATEQEGRDLFFYYGDKFNLSLGTPFLVFSQEVNGVDNFYYLIGDTPIISNSRNVVENFDDYGKPSSSFLPKEENFKERLTRLFLENLDQSTGKLSFLGWLLLILIALIDAVNPCAFGVLIFLMASLLRMGSSKRALRAGLIYSLVIFLTYFLVGVVLYKVIESFSSHSWFYLFYVVVAVVIFVLGLLQLKDLFWYGKGLTLKIPDFTKPIIEKFMGNPSLIVIIILGVLVSLFELPCTGEVYLGILTLMSLHQFFSLTYLIIYNLIFVLPLIILTLLIYKGISTEKLQRWTAENKKYMKLASGLLLVGLATYIFITAINFV